MKNRTVLAEYFKDLGFTYGAEIGVFEGRYSEILFQQIPNLKLLCVDSWKLGLTHPKKKRAIQLLNKYNATIIHKSSMDAVKNVKDGSLDFVFIDASHKYADVRDDIREWAKKVRKGGIVSGHDYAVRSATGNDVVRPVNEYVHEHGYKLLLTKRDRNNPHKDDRVPCWYFFV